MTGFELKGDIFLCIETVFLFKNNIETDIILYTKGNEYQVYECGCLKDDLGELRDWFMRNSIATIDCEQLRIKHFKKL